MNCPRCHQKLKKITGASHYGVPIKLDQCPSCGGMWFEKMELWQIGYNSAKEIDSFRQNTTDMERCLEFSLPPEEEPKSPDTTLMCPQCSAALEKYSDANFPANVIVEHCPCCEGFWLDQGELVNFKELLKQKKEELNKYNIQLMSRQSAPIPGASSLASDLMAPAYTRNYYRAQANLLIWLINTIFKGIKAAFTWLINLFAQTKGNQSSGKKSLNKRQQTKGPSIKIECKNCHRMVAKSEGIYCPFCNCKLTVDNNIISLNKATTNDLLSLPMLKISVAQRIIDYREHNGPFYKKTDLLKVRGMTPQTFAQIKDMIAIDITDSSNKPDHNTKKDWDRKLEL